VGVACWEVDGRCVKRKKRRESGIASGLKAEDLNQDRAKTIAKLSASRLEC